MSMNNMLMGALKEKEEFTQTYNYTGGAQSFSIPSGVTEIEAYVFGPGGACDNNDGAANSVGGAGGFTTGTINTSAGGTLKIIVGQGGAPGTQENGSGGGYSAVCTNNWAGSSVGTDHASIIICSGGGGGAGDAGINGGYGGAGGGGNSSGQQGYPSSSGGGGGSSSGAGSYTGNGGGSCTSTCTGQSLRGGTGCGGAEGSGGVGWPNQQYGGNWGSAAGGNGCNAGGGGAG